MGSRRRIARAGWTVVLALVAAGCGGTGGAAGARPEVVASFYPIAELARRIGGDGVGVSNLTPAGAEPHDLELRPSDFRRLRSADLILYFGGGFQPALEDALGPVRSRAVDLLEGLPVAAGDPHVWLDPVLMEELAARVERALAERFPGRLASRAASYTAELRALQAEFERGLERCERREIFTSHAAFAYLARRYRLTQIAIAGISPEGEPSPRRLREVVSLAREKGATTIFHESLVSRRVAESVARATGASTALLDPIEGLTGEQIARGESYLTVMRRNLRALAKGLSCT